MKNKPSDLYIKGLLWAYKKGGSGFTKEELKAELNVSESDWPWVQWVFFNALNGDAPLMWFISSEYASPLQVDKNRYFLSAAGMAASVDYLELKHAQRSGFWAMAVAIAAMFISIGVGIAQIKNIQDVRMINMPETQKVQVQNEILKTEVGNFPKTQEVRIK